MYNPAALAEEVRAWRVAIRDNLRRWEHDRKRFVQEQVEAAQRIARARQERRLYYPPNDKHFRLTEWV